MRELPMRLDGALRKGVKPGCKRVGMGVIAAAGALILLLVLFQGRLRDGLQSYLVVRQHLPEGRSFDAAYVLGGGQKSLQPKLKTAARVHANGRCSDIYVLGRPGITEYDRSLGRNLTNDEWARMILNNHGVPEKSIHFVDIREGCFGTLSEARGVAEMARRKEWRSLLLVTSPHHTKRTKESFMRFLSGSGVDLNLVHSGKNAEFRELITEFAKLHVYRLIFFARPAPGQPESRFLKEAAG
jgi:uncharacterized SAM-binding protein YcdF (DUF218 family)